MEIEHLRQIVLLSKTLNFSNTAKQLFITQPTLSKHVTAAEKHLGLRLFDRTGRFVRLTEAGSRFVADAQSIVEQYDDAVGKLRAFSNAQVSTLIIGYADILLDEWKDRIVKAVAQNRPYTEIQLKLCNPSKLLDSLKSEQIDIAIAPFFAGREDDPAFYTHRFEPSRLALVCPDSHPLAQKKSVCIADFKSETMLVPDTDIRSGKGICDFFEARSMKINEQARFSSFFEASAMVSMQHGLALLPQYVRKFRLLNVRFVPIRDIDITVEPTMIWKKFGKNRILKGLSSHILTE